jgi:galactose mutarotase-like enzyme
VINLIKLFNEYLEISIKEKGAELNSIKDIKHDLEYLWQGDSNFWSGQSPILFPAVGKVRNFNYIAEDKNFTFGNHGFARGSMFEVVYSNESEALFRLNYSEETLKIYPYKFTLDVKYTLTQNSLKVTFEVKNLDNKDIYFSIGAHPAFNCPILSGESFEDYYLQFEQKETASIMMLNSDGSFKRELAPYLKNEDTIELNYSKFKGDALVFNNLKSESVTLKSHKNSTAVKFSFKGFPYLGIWTKFPNGPFICIEPWFGHGDYEDVSYSKDFQFKHREGILTLAEGINFEHSYEIEIL